MKAWAHTFEILYGVLQCVAATSFVVCCSFTCARYFRDSLHKSVGIYIRDSARCVAGSCSVLQQHHRPCVAVCCSHSRDSSRCVAVCCSRFVCRVLQCVAVCCRVLQCVAATSYAVCCTITCASTFQTLHVTHEPRRQGVRIHEIFSHDILTRYDHTIFSHPTKNSHIDHRIYGVGRVFSHPTHPIYSVIYMRLVCAHQTPQVTQNS